MSSGSYLGDGTATSARAPGDFDAWDKLQLGWLNYDVAVAGRALQPPLGPAESNTKAAQGALHRAPAQGGGPRPSAPPYAGSYAWYSGKGDNLDNSHDAHDRAARGARASRCTLQTWYDIEKDWDYAYVSVSTNGGASWTNLASTVTTNTNPNGQNFGNGITGTSGGWVAASFDLTPYAGRPCSSGLRYWTDGFVVNPGFLVDDLTIIATAATVFSDGAESAPTAGRWRASGPRPAARRRYFNHYYLAEYRQYRGYDRGLQTGPYNFGFLNTLPNWVEHFPYQNGLLISYWDTSRRTTTRACTRAKG